LKIQLVSRSKHSDSIIKSRLLMLCAETCLFRDPYKTHKCNLWAESRISRCLVRRYITYPLGFESLIMFEMFWMAFLEVGLRCFFNVICSCDFSEAVGMASECLTKPAPINLWWKAQHF